MKIVTFSLEPGNKYFARVDGGQKFFVGQRVTYLGNKGLMNLQGTAEQKYDRAAFRQQYGFWADFIHPTAMAEGALYHTLNTYDRARFTFTFLQYAAHVPNGDFVVYMRALLGEADANAYFPDLSLVNNRISKTNENDGTVTQLESNSSTDGLMDYFNPALTEVEDTEVIQSAKLIHWAQNDPRHREIQIKVGIDHFKSKMRTYAGWYPMLAGAAPPICVMVADIHHQGRATKPVVYAALQAANPLTALLRIGQGQYDERLSTLRKEINALTAEGIYGTLKYDPATNSFV